MERWWAPAPSIVTPTPVPLAAAVPSAVNSRSRILHPDDPPRLAGARPPQRHLKAWRRAHGAGLVGPSLGPPRHRAPAHQGHLWQRSLLRPLRLGQCWCLPQCRRPAHALLQLLWRARRLRHQLQLRGCQCHPAPGDWYLGARHWPFHIVARHRRKHQAHGAVRRPLPQELPSKQGRPRTP